jgi:hypothetical protein
MTLPADLSPVERQHLRAQAEQIAKPGYFPLDVRLIRCECSEWSGHCPDCSDLIDRIEYALLAQRLQGRTEGVERLQQVEQLMEKWNRIVHARTPPLNREQAASWHCLRQCADDLATVLRTLPASPSVSPTAQTDQDT